MMDCTIALKVVKIVSLFLPQFEPVRALRTLFFDLSLFFRLVESCLKERRVSNVMPRKVGFFTVGTSCPSASIWSTSPASFENVENALADDLEGDINRFLLLNHSFRVAK